MITDSVRPPVMAVCALIAVALGTGFVSLPSTVAGNNIRPVIRDCDTSNRPVGCDMAGPMVGALRFMQNKQGDLVFTVAVWRGDPNTTYNIILFTGATYDDSFYDATGIIGTLITNGHGVGRTDRITVPAITLQDPRFGPLAHTDHINLFAGVTVLTATGIDYTVPAPSSTVS